ncbi:TIGR03943 family protein [Sporichthya sp.]|uniref:TIGR03943 family putative permease subunit n=1 Tax=Sporichthya sp. TaxID=65475 RepID=UPI00184899CE|nr:TIGR03943 family protein [Sporichthya sp.]MBA3742608.1 TIGR03943 family protein [Sporichthya sp.]
MTRAYQSVLLLVVGVALGSITVDGRYLNYLKPAMHVPLLLAALAFIVIGIADLLALRRAPVAADDIRCDHDEHQLPRAGWLLVLPVLAIGFVAPPPLGSWAAERDPGTVAEPDSSDFAALPAGDPARIPLSEYGVRAVWDDGRTLAGRTVEMIGFASPRKGGGWYLTRMTLTCCAADALATKVEVRGAVAPSSDSWVRVVGRYVASDAANPSLAVPVVEAVEVSPVDEPANPYE